MQALLTELASLLGNDDLLTEPADCWPYGCDNSRRQLSPIAVAFAREHAQVAEIVRSCARHGVAITARGRGTGTAGAAVPAPGALCLSFERMNRIIDIIPGDRIAIVQPGVMNGELQSACAAHGLFWPPDPSSAAYCSVGGNLACNAAGPRAIRYGTARENTLGLLAVSGTGDSLRTGCYTSKGVVGYDLTRLVIGSEGTLALITEATLKLCNIPEARHTLRAAFVDFAAAARALTRVMATPLGVSALEFMDRHAVALIKDLPGIDLPARAGALLIVELDGPRSAMQSEVAALRRALTDDGTLEVRVARSDTQREELWAARKALSPALRNIAPDKINEDVVVPVSKMPKLLEILDSLATRHGITMVNFGHAGNGNIHVNLLTDFGRAGERDKARKCLAQVFEAVLLLQGTLSGEHGIGYDKREFLGLEIEPAALALMKKIKQQFDPAGILNPDKLFVATQSPPASPAN